ncbi:MAG: DUF2949 domain-containing protein [Microcystaceae cyanobacterium]
MESNAFNLTPLCQFLQKELALSKHELALALDHQHHPEEPIPMLLWQYGLISTLDLQRIFDWQDNQSPISVWQS